MGVTCVHACAHTQAQPHTHAHICMHAHAHAQAHTLMRRHTHTFAHTQVHTRAHTCTDTPSRAHSPARTHRCAHAQRSRLHTATCTLTHAHAHPGSRTTQATFWSVAGGPVRAGCDALGRTQLPEAQVWGRPLTSPGPCLGGSLPWRVPGEGTVCYGLGVGPGVCGQGARWQVGDAAGHQPKLASCQGAEHSKDAATPASSRQPAVGP